MIKILIPLFLVIHHTQSASIPAELHVVSNDPQEASEATSDVTAGNPAASKHAPFVYNHISTQLTLSLYMAFRLKLSSAHIKYTPHHLMRNGA